jgi:hypothetical protein
MDKPKDEMLAYILERYSQKIMENAKKEQNDYLTYRLSLELKEDELLGVADFIGASGFTQSCMEALLRQRQAHFYFATMEGFPSGLQARTFYGKSLNSVVSQNPLVRHMACGEAVMSAPHGQFVRFEGTRPQFLDEGLDYTGMEACRKGIGEYFEDLLAAGEPRFFRPASAEFALRVFGALFDSARFQVDEAVKKQFVVASPGIPNEGEGAW